MSNTVKTFREISLDEGAQSLLVVDVSENEKEGKNLAVLALYPLLQNCLGDERGQQVWVGCGKGHRSRGRQRGADVHAPPIPVERLCAQQRL